VTSWVDELGLGRTVGWPAMGVRVDATPWPAPVDPAVLDLRRALLWTHPACAAALPGSEAACAEVAEVAGVDGGAVGLVPPPAGRPHGEAGCCGSPGPPSREVADLAAAAVAQGDDLCVLAAEPGWPLVAGVVLFPSHWRLADKLGEPLALVHDRVPGYPEAQVDRFLDRLEPGKAVWRRNLLVHRDGALHAPEAATDDVPVERWWLRSERQTLRRLPRSGAVLFAIHTDTAPLADLEPATRVALADRLASFPPTWGPYADLVAELPELVAWLRTT
jgi:hypothetical protein